MAEINPFESQQPPPFQWGGLTQLVPQEPLVEPEGGFLGGLNPMEGGSYNALSPEAMNLLWSSQTNSPQPQPEPLIPPQQPLM